MSKERLEELLDDLPYTIRHSGELEPLKQFAQVEYQEKVKLLAENKRYRDLLKKIKEMTKYDDCREA